MSGKSKDESGSAGAGGADARETERSRQARPLAAFGTWTRRAELSRGGAQGAHAPEATGTPVRRVPQVPA